jgi:hypothetical protein
MKDLIQSPSDNPQSFGSLIQTSAQPPAQMDFILERISGNVMRLADTGTRMEAVRLRDLILQELEIIKPILFSDGCGVFSGNTKEAKLERVSAERPQEGRQQVEGY